jgi:formylglycine-generating enzyme required for sulfatase activity
VGGHIGKEGTKMPGRISWLGRAVVAAVVCVGVVSAASAQVNIETVPVGNPGNAGEWSGESSGGSGPDRICGAVDYEYRIGTYEVTAGQYCEFLNAVDPTGANAHGLYNSEMDTHSYGCQITWNAGASTYDFSGAPSGSASDWENRPVNYVSWYDAAMFANWLTSGSIHQGAYDTSSSAGWGDSDAGNYTGIDRAGAISTYGKVYVIPTEDEWYKAAYHKKDGVTGNYFDYPTSSDTAPSNDLINPDPCNNATFYDSGFTIGSPYYRTEVGDHENSESPYGTFDQGGNVWEWNEAILYGSDRGLRGGSFDYNVYSLHASNRDNYFDTTPTRELYPFGFRVSEVPEPGTMALLALGCVGMLVRRRNVRG